MRTSALRLGIALVLISGTVAYATLSDGGARDHVPAAKAAGQGSPAFRARGHVGHLYPGAVRKMRVRIRNRLSDPIRLGYIRTKTHDAGPGCGRENLVIERRRTGVKIRPGRWHLVRIKVRMVPEATDACQGARFPLRFSVRGKRP